MNTTHNAIILSSYHLINGTLFDVFEYYICLLENNVPIKLIILNDLNFHKLFHIFEEKYILDDLNWKDHIILLQSKANLLKYIFTNVLLFDYTTIKYCADVIKCTNMHIITNKINYKKINRAIYYTEIYQHWYYDVKYLCKFLFHRYKSVKKSVNCSCISILGTVSNFTKYMSNEKYFVKNNKFHYTNFFSLFDEFVYITDGTVFDCHPRLFHECYFYNKKIKYVTFNNIYDGAYYRYMDLIKNGIQNRYLTNTDELIQRIIN